MNLESEIIEIIRDVLVLGTKADEFSGATGLMGALPEFDSVAVVSLITATEDEYGCVFEDDEITAENFENIGSFVQLVKAKLEE